MAICQCGENLLILRADYIQEQGPVGEGGCHWPGNRLKDRDKHIKPNLKKWIH